MMFEKYLIPLLIAKELKAIGGKTRLQKLVRLVQSKLEGIGISKIDYEYKLHHHGPFSFQLARITETLVEGRYLSERREITPDNHVLFVYKLTQKGREMLKDSQKKSILGKRIAGIVRDVSKEYGYMSLPDLVEEAYATM